MVLCPSSTSSPPYPCVTGFPKAAPFRLLRSPQVVIQVLDVNDCRPRFSKPQYSTSVYENEPAGTSVITMLATDEDEGSNGQLTYSLEGPGMGMWPSLAAQENLKGREKQAAVSITLGRGQEEKEGAASPFTCSLPLPEAFSVDMDSGLVTTQRPLQSYERFNLTVVATDGGEPPLWGTTMLLVEVIDVNDNRPVFVRPPNGTILHIKEVSLIQGPLPTDTWLPHPACCLDLHSPPNRVGGPIARMWTLRPGLPSATWERSRALAHPVSRLMSRKSSV